MLLYRVEKKAISFMYLYHKIMSDEARPRRCSIEDMQVSGWKKYFIALSGQQKLDQW
jgi:hypothetical protein